MTNAIIPDHYQLIGDDWIEWHSTLASALESTALIEAFCIAEVCPSDCVWRDITEDAAIIWAEGVDLVDETLPVMFEEHLSVAKMNAEDEPRVDPNTEHYSDWRAQQL